MDSKEESIKEEPFTFDDEFHSKDDMDFASEELQGQSCGSGNSLNGFHHNSVMFEDNANVIYIKEDVDEYQIKQEEFHEDTKDIFEGHHDKIDYEISNSSEDIFSSRSVDYVKGKMNKEMSETNVQRMGIEHMNKDNDQNQPDARDINSHSDKESFYHKIHNSKFPEVVGSQLNILNKKMKIVNPQKTFTDRRGLVDVHPMVMVSLNSSNEYIKDKGNTEGEDVPIETFPIEASSSQVENQSIKKFRCSFCGYETNQKGHLNAHLLTHSNTKLFKCTECDYECIQKSNLKKHLLTHSNVKLFKCTECDYEGNRKDHLKQHLLTHSNMKLFKCTECDYEGNRRDHLRQHLLTHTSNKFFKCSECDYECFQKTHLKRHSLIHSDTKLFKCAECKYESKWKEGLKRHLLTHLKKKSIEAAIGNIDVRT